MSMTEMVVLMVDGMSGRKVVMKSDMSVWSAYCATKAETQRLLVVEFAGVVGMA